MIFHLFFIYFLFSLKKTKQNIYKRSRSRARARARSRATTYVCNTSYICNPSHVCNLWRRIQFNDLLKTAWRMTTTMTTTTQNSHRYYIVGNPYIVRCLSSPLSLEIRQNHIYLAKVAIRACPPSKWQCGRTRWIAIGWLCAPPTNPIHFCRIQ